MVLSGCQFLEVYNNQIKLGKLLHALVFATDFGQNFSSCICMIRPKF